MVLNLLKRIGGYCFSRVAWALNSFPVSRVSSNARPAWLSNLSLNSAPAAGDYRSNLLLEWSGKQSQ